MTSLQPPRWTAPAGIFRIALRDRRELSQRGNTLQLVPRETAQCVLLRMGSMEALKPQRQLWLSTGRTPGAMAAAPNPLEQQPQHSLQGELPGSFPAVRTAWHWYLEFTSGQQLCMLSPASWQGATHYLLLRRGVREEPGGHLVLTKVNPTHLFKSTLLTFFHKGWQTAFVLRVSKLNTAQHFIQCQNLKWSVPFIYFVNRKNGKCLYIYNSSKQRSP